MVLIWPQGWNFFANEPTTDVNVAIDVGGGGHLTATTELQMTHSTDWGLSRSAYALDVELGSLSSQVAAGDWLNCAQLAPTACEDAALLAPVVRSLNRTAHPTFCGHALIAVETPVRWTADTRLWQGNWKITKIVNSEIKCAG